MRKEIVFGCKAQAKTSLEIQKMVHQYILNRK